MHVRILAQETSDLKSHPQAGRGAGGGTSGADAVKDEQEFTERRLGGMTLTAKNSHPHLFQFQLP